MPNANIATGLRPVRYASGAPYNGSASTYFAPASDGTALFIGDPVIIAGSADATTGFEIQEDAVGGALAVTGIGLNADLIAASGSTVTKRSGFQLDTSTAATTATLQLRIERFVNRADNDIGAANAKVLVRINLPTQTGAAGSTGV